MSTIKSILNNTITKMVTRSRVLIATGIREEEFDYWVDTCIAEHYSNSCKYEEWTSQGYGGVDCFIRDFCEEGWCKDELSSILNTLFHLNREISEYGTYWF